MIDLGQHIKQIEKLLVAGAAVGQRFPNGDHSLAMASQARPAGDPPAWLGMINHSTTVELDVAAGSCAEFVSSHKATNAAQKGHWSPYSWPCAE